MNGEQQVLQTPFVSSWLGQAVQGNVHDEDLDVRARAWAYWMITHTRSFTGLNERTYPAVALPGKFYKAPTFKDPHLEIPTWLLRQPDPDFPLRLAAMGNGLLSEWWVPDEATAAKRVLFNSSGDVREPLTSLESTRDALVKAVQEQVHKLRSNWTEIEGYLAEDPTQLSQALARGFHNDAVISYHPDLEKVLNLKEIKAEITVDPKLLARSGPWLSRRVGVWNFNLSGAGQNSTWGVLTPRLTKSSQCFDALYKPGTESTSSLLVRGLVLHCLLDIVGVAEAGEVAHTWISSDAGSLRSMPARSGEAVPRASVKAAVAFVHAYPEARDAWQAIQSWCGSREGLECVVLPTKETFLQAHRKVKAASGKAESPDPLDVESLLPLIWSTDIKTQKRSVVRLTFVRS